ncbi:hypothetical protein Sango_1239200 [Sesamum angolense]|uniref:Uncharacterized protein n=1 Tax=Sesamum angolense TaxID=2727404 RepID=A0AAE2BTX9_9LAMI|nr:hypothetical protein Sango_1239200 [Sesamum angolense]
MFDFEYPCEIELDTKFEEIEKGFKETSRSEIFKEPPESPPAALFPQVDTLHARVETLQKTVGEWPDVMGQRAIAAVEEMSILTDAVDVKVESLQAEVNLLKQVVGREEDRAPVSKVKVPDSKPSWRCS